MATNDDFSDDPTDQNPTPQAASWSGDPNLEERLRNNAPELANSIKDVISGWNEEMREYKQDLEDLREFKQLNAKVNKHLGDLIGLVETERENLENAKEHLKQADDHLETYREHGKEGAKKQCIKNLEEARELAQNAEDIDDRIENKTESLDQTVKEEVREIKEIGKLESSAENIAQQADSLLDEIEGKIMGVSG